MKREKAEKDGEGSMKEYGVSGELSNNNIYIYIYKTT